MKKLLTLLICLICYQALPQTPIGYWTFENSSTPFRDSASAGAIDPNYYHSGYNIKTDGVVGKYLDLGTTGNLVKGPDITLSNSGFTVVFMTKFGPLFNQCQIIQLDNYAFSLRVYPDYISFATNSAATGVSYLDIAFDGVGPKSLGYYMDNGWHQWALQYNATSGVKSIYVDGVQIGTTTLTSSTLPTTSKTLYLNTGTSYFKYYGGIDEVAIYNSTLTETHLGSLAYHATALGEHYGASSPGHLASPDNFQRRVAYREFAPGFENNSITLTPLEQLRKAPSPRLRPQAKAMRNVNWMALDYFSGYYQSGINSTALRYNSLAINWELARNWNYYLLTSVNTSGYTQFSDTTQLAGAWIKQANENPNLPTAALTFWPQIDPRVIGKTYSAPYCGRADLPASSYIRDGTGKYITEQGTTTNDPNYAVLSPLVPKDSAAIDGSTQKFYIQQLVNKLTRPLDYISENGEVIKVMTPTNLAKDPAIAQARNESGLSYEDYQSKQMADKYILYRNKIMEIPQLQTWKTVFSPYQMCGDTVYRFRWKYARNIFTPINGCAYATQDVYTRWPSNWREGTSAWNGWKRFIWTLPAQLANKDTFCAPFVSAGWDTNSDTVNIRPAQWLGLLKVMCGAGAKYFHSAYFNIANSYSEQSPPVNPKTYAYQVMMPVYAQAAVSRANQVFDTSTILDGDMPLDYVQGLSAGSGYTFQSGDPRIITVVRKSLKYNYYLIFTTLQQLANDSGACEESKTATINLEGRTLSFTTRRQGSIYLYNIQSPDSPKFYQLDGWHESLHPNRWSSNIVLEAELGDNVYFNTKTVVTDSTQAHNQGDYTSFQTWVNTKSTSDRLTWTFNQKDSTTMYFWIYAKPRTAGGQKITVSVDNINAQQIKVATAGWHWYRVNNSNVNVRFTGLSTNKDHALNIYNANNTNIDKVILTPDPSYQP